MSVVGTKMEIRRFRYMLPEMKASEAVDYIEKEKDKKIREEQAKKELMAMQPILILFQSGYDALLGKEMIEQIVQSFDRPIAKYSLIIRLGNKLEECGLSRKTWETIAMKAFL